MECNYYYYYLTTLHLYIEITMNRCRVDEIIKYSCKEYYENTNIYGYRAVALILQWLLRNA